MRTKALLLTAILMILVLPSLHAGEDKTTKTEESAMNHLTSVISKNLKNPEAILLQMTENKATIHLWVDENGKVILMELEASNPCLQNFIQTRLDRSAIQADSALYNRAIQIRLNIK